MKSLFFRCVFMFVVLVISVAVNAEAPTANPVLETVESSVGIVLQNDEPKVTDGVDIQAVTANDTASATADKPKLSYEKSSPNTGAQLFTVIMSLGLIIALIYALSLFVKRFGQGLGYANQNIKLVANLAVGTRERVALLDVAGKQILVGITPQQINTLHVFDEAVVVAEASKPLASGFAEKLKAALKSQEHSSS